MVDNPDPNDSHLRVFLSADLVGSTRLKNQLNHRELFEKYRTRRSVLDALENNGVKCPDDLATETVLQSLSISTEDFDWASVVQYFYEGFHSELAANIEMLCRKHGLPEVKDGLKPWKAVGDELIYQFVVASRRHLHWLVIAFLSSMRVLDNKIASRHFNQALRIKSSAWVAGFPVRNRIIKLPAIDSYDFLGPDIDAGFRIGKCTREGMLVVSLELAELLAETPGDVNCLLAKIVGWEELKGVWSNKPYPVIWVDLPSGYETSNDNLRARAFDDWQRLECAWCEAWQEATPIRDLSDRLRNLRENLPKSLGVVDPYISSDAEVNDKIPESHREILDLIRLVGEHQQQASKQDDIDEPPSDSTFSANESVNVDEIVRELLDSDSSEGESNE